MYYRQQVCSYRKASCCHQPTSCSGQQASCPRQQASCFRPQTSRQHVSLCQQASCFISRPEVSRPLFPSADLMSACLLVLAGLLFSSADLRSAGLLFSSAGLLFPVSGVGDEPDGVSDGTSGRLEAPADPVSCRYHQPGGQRPLGLLLTLPTQGWRQMSDHGDGATMSGAASRR